MEFHFANQLPGPGEGFEDNGSRIRHHQQAGILDVVKNRRMSDRLCSRLINNWVVKVSYCLVDTGKPLVKLLDLTRHKSVIGRFRWEEGYL